jgi:transcriptional regulator with XRE-family HTH domain
METQGINERVKLLRKSIGITQTEFANRLRFQPSSVSRLESGENAVTDSTLNLISFTFNANADWLRTGEGDMFASYDDDIDLPADELELLQNYRPLNASNKDGAMQYIQFLLSQQNTAAPATTPAPKPPPAPAEVPPPALQAAG